jgi:hypothetical protein
MKLNEAAKKVLISEGDEKSLSLNQLSSEYDKMYNQMKNGEISDQEWYDYCANLLGDILDDNKDVMVRLKNR